jgi:hypothetical protein
MNVSISKKFARVTLGVLLVVALSLCLTSFAIFYLKGMFPWMFPSQVYGFDLAFYISILDVDDEATIQAWFSSSLLLSCSILLGVIASGVKSAGERYKFHWLALSITFALLSLDEAISVHESFVNPMRSLFNTRGLLFFGWVIPGGAFVLVFVLAYLKFLFYLPSQTRRQFMVAGALYISGALGLEMLGGLQADLYGKSNLTYAALLTAEEFLEMTGAILFLYALMRYTGHRGKAGELK